MPVATWDERKRHANIKAHGLDFVGCEAIWDDLTITREDIRQRYNEQRLVAFGRLNRQVAAGRTSSRCARPKSMKRVTTLQKPRSFKTKAKDSANPPWSEEMLGPTVVRRGRGPQKTPIKVSTTIRLDADVLAYFRATGRGYQSQINDELRKVVKRGLTMRSSGRRSA